MAQLVGTVYIEVDETAIRDKIKKEIIDALEVERRQAMNRQWNKRRPSGCMDGLQRAINVVKSI